MNTTGRPTPNADAFDACPERRMTTVATPVFSDDGRRRSISPFDIQRYDEVVTCPRYPESVEFIVTPLLDDREARDRAAYKLGCATCEFAQPKNPDEALTEMLHGAISKASAQLFLARHYPEAALNGYKTVKERLRDLTGYEAASEAIGKGGLYFPTSAAEHVDGMHQQAIANLLRSGDNFRNEFSHTAPTELVDRITRSVAFGHLNVASLAMRHLDTAVVRPK